MLWALCLLLAVKKKKKKSDNGNHTAKPRTPPQDLHGCRYHQRDHLSGGHDDREDDGSEFLDGVEDEQLPGSRGDRQGHHVVQGLRVRRQEPEAVGEPAVLEEKKTEKQEGAGGCLSVDITGHQ